MNPLDALAARLRESLEISRRISQPNNSLGGTIDALKSHLKSGANASMPEDLQLQAVRRFWEVQRLDTLREARLVAFSLCLPVSPSGPCVMEDRQRFRAVLDQSTGLDQWVGEPRWFRRGYQGLVRSYFSYHPKRTNTPKSGRDNWIDLRDYLNERSGKISGKKADPEWVTAVTKNRKLFSDEPCKPYAAAVLQGKMEIVENICDRLGIAKSSWFLEELVLAQVQQATTYSHTEFADLVPVLLDLLAANPVLRDRGMVLLLDRHAQRSPPPFSEPLRNASVEWWGNPWLPSNEMRWGGVKPAAREMVADWLKREFIEAFFTKLAEDGVGDRRRANFWLRYVKAMDNVQFGLGWNALSTNDRDFVALRKKMTGLFTELKSSDGSNNAFIMTLGDLVAVEFGAKGHAFYGYDVRKKLPFSISTSVGIAVGARNSLKNEAHIIRLSHRDGIKGWDHWEEMFEETLKDEFAILPDSARHWETTNVRNPTGPVGRRPKTENTEKATTNIDTATKAESGGNAFNGVAFSPAALSTLATLYKLQLDDKKASNGNLWIRTDDTNTALNSILRRWKFSYRPGKGWWR